MKYTDELDKVSYSLGLSIASNLISSGVTTINAEAFIDGLNVVFSGKMPEIMPDEARKGGARVIATGRSDFPNQINNVLVFPGVFKGALSVRAKEITELMKQRASYAIASMIPDEELTPENIIASPLNKGVADVVAKAVADTAIEEGIARI